jgi:HEPN domain-containing protein
MALEDIPRISRSFEASDYSDVAYRVQFCSEKIVKGLLLFYGVQFKKYREVSEILHDEILSDSQLEAEENQHLEKIFTNATFLETISTSPRYGAVIDGKFTPPKDLYDIELVRSYIDRLIDEFSALVALLGLKDQAEWQYEVEAFSNGNSILQSLVD